ncbi:hypothetical protein ABH944_008926, partial [Caballeronia udeis]|uniref:hypothetical protein n=1 Tax=Caballeronia udeis TaxID=1232866 RepID=UPI0038351453
MKLKYCGTLLFTLCINLLGHLFRAFDVRPRSQTAFGKRPSGVAFRRAGSGHERSFDTDHHIGNNLRAGFFSAHSHGDQTN